MTPDPDQYRLSEPEHQRIYEYEIRPVLFRKPVPVHEPVAVILGGQPGAGKSASIVVAVNELAKHGGAVKILGDELRSYHPHYQNLLEKDDKTAAFYTDRDSGLWVEKNHQGSPVVTG